MIKKICLIFICVLILISNGFTKTEMEISDDRAVMLLNYLQYSLAQIKKNPNKIVAEHEFETIVRYINPTILKDEGIISAYKDMLDTLSDLELLDEEKKYAEEVAARERKRAFLAIFQSPGSIFVPGQHPLVSLAYVAVSAGLNYCNAMSIAESNELETKFKIDMSILRTLNDERRNLYTQSAKVFSSRKDTNKIVPEDLMNAFVEAVNLQDSKTKENRLKNMKSMFSMFPPFWFALGYSQQENRKYDDALKSYSEYERLMANEHILNFDEMYCQLLFAKIEIYQQKESVAEVKKCIKFLEEEAEKTVPERQAQIYYGIALAYYGLKNYSSSREYSKKAMDLGISSWNETILELQAEIKNQDKKQRNFSSNFDFKRIKGFGQNGLTEFINVETTFIFAHEGSSDGKIKKVYGSKHGVSQNYGIPVYKVGEDVYLDIEFKSFLLKKDEKKARKLAKVGSIDIPVEVCISGNNDIDSIEKSKGVSEIVPEELSDESIYRFSIEDGEETKYVRFKIKSKKKAIKDVENVVVKTKYGTVDYKIVDEMCDVFETISFVPNQNRF